MIAASDYLINILVLIIFYLSDKIGIEIVIILAVLSILVNAIFVFLITFGISESFHDPSVTTLQIFTGCAMNILAMAMAPQIAYLFAINLFIPLAHGSLQFKRDEFILAWVLVTIAMVLTLSLSGSNINTMLVSKSDQYLFILVTSLALGRFLFINAEVSTIRRRLRDKNRALKKAYSQLREVTSRDALTGLVNKQAFLKILDEISQPILEIQQYYVAIVDIDNLDRINTTHGKDVGDKIIGVVGDILSCRLRRSDCVARINGEAFALLLTHTSLNHVTKVLERARKQIEDTHWPYYGSENKVTVSVGIAEWSRGEDPNLTIENAHTAVRRAKSQGRNRLFVFERKEDHRPDLPMSHSS